VTDFRFFSFTVWTPQAVPTTTSHNVSISLAQWYQIVVFGVTGKLTVSISGPAYSEMGSCYGDILYKLQTFFQPQKFCGASIDVLLFAIAITILSPKGRICQNIVIYPINVFIIFMIINCTSSEILAIF
jgi:hypothetical protein